MTGNKPEQVFRIGTVSASVFVNPREAGDENRRETRSVAIQRRYLDRKANEWKTADTFWLADLPALREVIDLALKYIAAKEASA